jgi:hypothetical protein
LASIHDPGPKYWDTPPLEAAGLDKTINGKEMLSNAPKTTFILQLANNQVGNGR